jgi:hypothetical protein
LACALGACDDQRTYEEFDSAITRIAGNAGEKLGVCEELLLPSKDFIRIYETPQPYFRPALALMTRRDVSTFRKEIAAYTMLRLPEERFLEMVSAVADSVEQGVTDAQVLDELAFPPLNFGRQHLLVHYQHAGVRAVLARLAKMKHLSESRRTYIQDKVLTGQAKLDYFDYMNYIEHKPAE